MKQKSLLSQPALYASKKLKHLKDSFKCEEKEEIYKLHKLSIKISAEESIKSFNALIEKTYEIFEKEKNPSIRIFRDIFEPDEEEINLWNKAATQHVSQLPEIFVFKYLMNCFDSWGNEKDFEYFVPLLLDSCLRTDQREMPGILCERLSEAGWLEWEEDKKGIVLQLLEHWWDIHLLRAALVSDQAVRLPSTFDELISTGIDANHWLEQWKSLDLCQPEFIYSFTHWMWTISGRPEREELQKWAFSLNALETVEDILLHVRLPEEEAFIFSWVHKTMEHYGYT